MHFSRVISTRSIGSHPLRKRRVFGRAFFMGAYDLHNRTPFLYLPTSIATYLSHTRHHERLLFFAGYCGFGCCTNSFAQMALLQEDLVRSRCGGTPGRLRVLDVRFVSPLLLPTDCMAVHVDDTTSSVYVTDTIGQVTMLGTFEADVCAQRSRL